MKTILPALIASLALTFEASAANTQRIATIDLRKVFDGFWRTKQANTKIQAEAHEIEKDQKALEDQFAKKEESYKGLTLSAKDPSLSEAEREKRTRAAENELLALRDLESRIKQFNSTSRARLAEQQRRIRDGILAEIRQVVGKRVAIDGYTLVLDSAAETPNGTPVVFHSSGADDLSNAVLKELNLSAPADLVEHSTPTNQ